MLLQRPDRDLALDTSRARVRCPRCGWQPDGGAHWGCDACFTLFDTFRTRATCPACGKRWAETQCPSCHALSPHEDWYAPETPRP